MPIYEQLETEVQTLREQIDLLSRGLGRIRTKLPELCGSDEGLLALRDAVDTLKEVATQS
jgi:hypothetical protein